MDFNSKQEHKLNRMKKKWRQIFEVRIILGRNLILQDLPVGIRIEMHTNEANHRGMPHCHAKYRNKEVSISLKDYSVVFSNGMDGKHQKMAVKCVQQNIELLRELWNENPNVIQL